MEIRQHGNTVCIHFSIGPLHMEGVIRKVKREKRKKQKRKDPMYLECMLEQQEALKRMEQNKWAAQDLLRIKNLF